MDHGLPADFDHRALRLREKKPIVFTALSKRYFYMRMLVVKFVLERGAVPLNPFMSFDYFLADTVGRDVVRNANNNLVALAGELWVFGPISDGVLAEIEQAKMNGTPIRFFEIKGDRDISEVSKDRLVFEEGMEAFRGRI
jgi:hypothetical protein